MQASAQWQLAAYGGVCPYGMTVGLLAGNSQNQYLSDFAEENGFTYQTREYEDIRRMEKDLQSGTIDAILTSNLRRADNEMVLDTIKVRFPCNVSVNVHRGTYIGVSE